jgi:hypothetical protein
MFEERITGRGKAENGKEKIEKGKVEAKIEEDSGRKNLTQRARRAQRSEKKAKNRNQTRVGEE